MTSPIERAAEADYRAAITRVLALCDEAEHTKENPGGWLLAAKIRKTLGREENA